VYLQFSEFLQNTTLRLSTNKNAWKQHAPVLHFAPLWPDGEAQKVITLGILLFGRAPQVYYFGLHRMKCEFAMAESVADLSQNKLGLLLRFAMHHHIICLALKWLFWVVFVHPFVETYMHEDIG
jgi:hypothetical protein